MYASASIKIADVAFIPPLFVSFKHPRLALIPLPLIALKISGWLSSY
jgi:hypothetical protein